MHYFIQLSPFLHIYAIRGLQPHPQPLPVGEGSEYLHFLLENRAQRPCSTMIGLANLSRTVVSVPRPPTRSKGIYSPLQRGGVGGGAVVP